MKIVVENNSYGFMNMGDVSMLQVAVARLSKLWPNAVIEVVTSRADLLAIYCPQARPIPLQGRETWLKDKKLLGGRLYRFCPRPIYGFVSRLDCEIRFHRPWLAYQWISLKSKYSRSGLTKDVATFLRSLFEADLVIIPGQGILTDVFAPGATKLLDIIRIATCYRKPIVMFGQGIGPIQNPLLLAKAKGVLPSLDLIAIREKRTGLPLLKALGIAPERIVVTGDDAIELAYEARNATFGSGIGVNLRVAFYSDVHGDHLKVVRTTLCAASRRYKAPLIPVPILRHTDHSDAETIRELFRGYDDTSDGGENLDNPLKVISQVRDCRLVVTASYHGAVFALAQGIPVIGLVKSAYYIEKFLGLADQFGLGCEVISFDDPLLPEKLTAGIDAAWESAEHMRPRLLEAARQQIELSRAAYQRVHDFILARNKVSRTKRSRLRHIIELSTPL
jgi:polysaccharide pyruvyl transferase WcaK-like protein